MTIEIYQDKSGGYRWRAKASNGLIVADSGESYTRLRDAKRALRRMAWSAMTAKLVIK